MLGTAWLVREARCIAHRCRFFLALARAHSVDDLIGNSRSSSYCALLRGRQVVGYGGMHIFSLCLARQSGDAGLAARCGKQARTRKNNGETVGMCYSMYEYTLVAYAGRASHLCKPPH